MNPEPLIHLENIKKVFYTDEVETHALAEIHLTIGQGEYVSIAGPSGCGKSTLLSILGLLDTPTEGTYTLNHQAVANLDFAARARIRNKEIGFIFQSFNLIGDLTVFENVELPLTYRGMSAAERKDAAMKPKERAGLNKKHVGFVFQQFHLLEDLTVAENLDIPLSYRDIKKPQRESLVADTLDRFGIVAKKDLFPSQLSGGHQQLVAVARAIIAQPTLLLADEPTGNLHSDQGRQIMELLKKLNTEGTTIIQVTHSETNAACGNRIIRLRDGWMEK